MLTSSTVKLKKVHPDLVRVALRAQTLFPKGFEVVVTCGLRTLEEQKKNMAAGASQTLRSRHLPGKKTGLAHAIDLAVKIDGILRWDWPLYAKLAGYMKTAAKLEKVPVEWGGDWKTLKDGPHFQLPWASYPG